ncbi:Transient receptor potential channel pyrexia [Folsomia candida]|uniref:Transient receptor potential channel pyrexia n=1 Tax=Folsomia candida TaxID=158441 RepID=A0A226DJV0_FOLCA|nr:Transient receptor potential channel pyrexia [Folsomia candida]
MVILLGEFGADVTLCDDKDQTPLDLIYINLPKLTIKHFNTGVKYDASHEKIELDFNTLTNIKGSKNAGNLLQETRSFEGLLKESPETVKEVLNHPLMQAFLYFKYQKAYPLIIASIGIHIFWHAIYAYFIFNVYYTNCPWLSKSSSKDNSTPEENNPGVTQINCDPDNFQPQELTLAVTCWLLCVLFFAKELFEMLTVPSWSRYFFELENIGQLFVIGSVFWTSWPVYEFIGGAEKISISPWQYKLACVTVFIVWSLVLGQVCKIQQLRILIEIFIKVFKSFFKFICTFASLLFAFAFSFCIIMPEGKAFKSPWLAVPKVLVMMTGELNYDDVFHTEDDATGVSPSHYVTTQELRANCHSAELSSMLEEIFLLESFAARVYKVVKIRWFLDTLSIRKKDNISLPERGWIFKMCSNQLDTNLELNGLIYSYSFAKNEKFPFPSGLIEDLRDLADLNSLAALKK